MNSLKTRLENNIYFIQNNYPSTSIERIRYVKIVKECYILINKLVDSDFDYIQPKIKQCLGKYQQFLGGKEIGKSLNKSQCRKIKDKFSNKCAICGFNVDSILEVHHVIPKSLCGKNDENNLIALCPTCHVIFHDIEQKGKVTDDIEDYLIVNGILESTTEYTKHLIIEKQSYQASFNDIGCMIECRI